jgi:hypothetical protein
MDRWYWVELIGFDNTSPDFGVSAYLSRNQSTTGVSLLFSHIDFLFADDEVLAPTACSYGGHEYNRERRRQEWTKTQLKGLIKELHAHGVKVFFSCFDMTDTITDPTWRTYSRSGKPSSLVYVLKRLENGTVGDVVIERLRAVLDEYGFDGLQLADGLSSNRPSIENGDFSVPFCRQSGISIPEKLMGEDVESYAARRAWILKHKRYEWICFLADAWADFYGKLFDAIKKPIMFNIAWTRGPFEALYRYGLDYGRCQLDRAFAVMIEENSATRAITSPEDEGAVEFSLAHRDTFPYEYALMQQQIKLHTGGLSQISLMPISDTQEQWDALRHCPTELTRAIVKRYNNFVWKDGKFIPCCDAPHYCLSDGIPAEDWRWLAKQESYRLPPVDLVEGFVGVYNPDALYRDVAQFCRKKHYFGAALQQELICAGLHVGAQVALADVGAFDRAKALLVTDLDTYTAAQKAELAKTKLPILAVGEDVDLPLENCTRYTGKYLSVALYNAPVAPDLTSLAGFERMIRRQPLQNGEIWTEPLSHRRVSADFFKALAESMNEAFDLDRAAPDVKLTSYRCAGEKYVILSNDRHTYYLPTVTTAAPVKGATALMKDKGYTVRCKNNTFTVRIPPRCVEIVKVEE